MNVLAGVPGARVLRRAIGRLGFLFVPLAGGALGCGSSEDAGPPAAAPPDAGEASSDVNTAVPPDEASTVDAANAQAPICSADHWCWDQPRPQGNDLFAVWGSDASHLFAVGELGTVLQFDGVRWTGAAWPGKGAIRAIWGTGAEDVWGVGDAGGIAHFDGTGWTVEAFPADGAASDAGSKPRLLGLAGTSKTNVWAVGEGGTVLHFDGASWSNPPSGTFVTLRGVFATEDEAWAVGDGSVVAHFDGSAWTADSKAALGFGLTAVHGTGKTDVWAAGDTGYVAHFDGVAWTSTLLQAGVALRGVVAESTDSVWAAGDDGSVWHLGAVTAPEAGPSDADGPSKDAKGDEAPSTRWSKVATGSRAAFNGIWQSGPGDIWFAGASGELRRWNGNGWDRVGIAGSGNRLAISGTSMSDMWIVGDEALHNSGAGWVHTELGTDRSLYGVSLTDAKTGWGIGTAGTIVHIGAGDGGGSEAIGSPTSKWLRGVWTSGSTAGWVVGGSGTALALLNGTAWQSVSTGGVTIDLHDVWGSAVGDVWAVGEGGTILHWRGTSWALVPNGADGGTTNGLRGLWGSGPKDIWAVGTGGTILHYNGAAWSAVAGGETYSLNDVWGSGTADVWAVGTGGTILHWDGTSWKAQESGTNSSLNSVWGPNATHVWAVGESGAILRYEAP